MSLCDFVSKLNKLSEQLKSIEDKLYRISMIENGLNDNKRVRINVYLDNPPNDDAMSTSKDIESIHCFLDSHKKYLNDELFVIKQLITRLINDEKTQ